MLIPYLFTVLIMQFEPNLSILQKRTRQKSVWFFILILRFRFLQCQELAIAYQ